MTQCSSLMDIHNIKMDENFWRIYTYFCTCGIPFYSQLEYVNAFFQISFDHAFRIFFFLNFAHGLFFLCVKLNNVRHSPSQVWFSNQERPKNGFQIIFAQEYVLWFNWLLRKGVVPIQLINPITMYLECIIKHLAIEHS